MRNSIYVGCLPDDPVKRILWAAETGKVDIVNEMLSLSCDLLSAKDADGYTPLHRAAYEGQTEIVQVCRTLYIAFLYHLSANHCDHPFTIVWSFAMALHIHSSIESLSIRVVHGLDSCFPR